jgi:hypothetical protein
MSSYNNHQSQDEIRKYFSSETPENIVQFLFIGNNLKTFYVLLDRAAWLRKGHDALLADGMAIIRKLNPRIPSHVCCLYIR